MHAQSLSAWSQCVCISTECTINAHKPHAVDSSESDVLQRTRDFLRPDDEQTSSSVAESHSKTDSTLHINDKYSRIISHSRSIQDSRRHPAKSPYRYGCQQQQAGSKTMLEKNPAVLNWGFRLMQVVLYNGRKTVAVVTV